MPEPIQHLNLTQFRLLLPDEHALSRKIAQVHVHHTWKPARADFRGRDTIEAMRDYHLSLGWIDIAQHLTVDPQGGLWTGRNWNLPPASSKGHNGTVDVGPFMIEVIGNFDKGHDRFDRAQRDTTMEVVAHVLRVYDLTVDAIRFHRELNNNLKTCPGSGIDRKTFDTQVGKVLEKKRPAPAALFAREFLRGVDVTRPVMAASRDATRDATVPEHDAAGVAIEQRTRSSVAAAQRTIRYSADLSRLIEPQRARGEDWSMLKPHVVNLSKGALSEGGEFATSPADLDRIIDAIADHAATDPQLRIVLYAHGGLVEETGALGYAKRMFDWWLGKGVYPVFFIWESGLLEILRQYIVGPRDVWDFTADPAIEIAAKAPGTLAWSGMKDSARRASAADLGEGAPGGAYLFCDKLARFAQRPENAAVTVHTVGHSAGAIFHAHLVPMLRAHGLANVASLSLLAPACRTELFNQALLPLLTNGYIQRHHMFTMEDEAERQDDCFRVYHKSLLYLVSHSFEGLARQPILGLDRSMRKDPTLAALYGLGGAPAAPNVEVQFSLARDKEENPLTRSVTHGGFDNDHKTISSVIRRILGIADDTGFGEADFPYPPLPRSFDPSEIVLVAPSRVAFGAQNRPTTLTSATRRRLALCIGIDRYRDRPLAGCVNDARAWGHALTGLDFDVRYLLDEQATYQAIIDGLRGLMSGAHAGDVLVMQYSGHGTQLPDDNGDEPFDQAFVPVDYHTGALFLRDDVVGAALEGLPTGAGLTLFMDCCHSGTISRFAPAMRAQESDTDRVRFLPLTPELLGAHRSYRRSRGRAAPVESAPGVIHFAACRDQEYAWETDGRGDFTVAATAALAAAVTRGDTNEAFIDGVARDVRARNRQHPEMMLAATGMNSRRLLAPLTAEASISGAAPVSSSAIDAELVARLESVVELLKQRVVR